MLTFAFAMLLTLAPQQPGSTARPSCVELSAEGDIFRGSGDCVLEYEDMRFEAAWITFNSSTSEVMAGDHIHFTRGTENIEGSHVTLNVKTKAGTIWDATGIVEPGFHVVAKVAERYEDSSWEFRNATITACESVKPCWTIAQAQAFFRPGEWVRGRNSVFRFHGVPIFYLPYASVSIKARDRASGFLTPTFGGSGKKGFRLSNAYYQTLGRSADVTVRNDIYTARGIGFGADLRTQANSRSFFNAGFYIVKDRTLGHKADADHPDPEGCLSST